MMKLTFLLYLQIIKVFAVDSSLCSDRVTQIEHTSIKYAPFWASQVPPKIERLTLATDRLTMI